MVNWSPNSALIRAFRSRSALAQSARIAVAAGGQVADLRRDAWGHGLLAVAEAVCAAGARAVRVDTVKEVAALSSIGLTGVIDEPADIDPLLLYGLPDADGRSRSQPVLRVAGRVLSTKPLLAGEAVSYGYTFRAAQDTTLALMTGGYAQGLVRALGNHAQIELGGTLHRIVGRIAMDVCVADIGGAVVETGAEGTFFGGTGPAAHALADWTRVTGLAAAELVTVVGMHAERAEEA